MIRLYATPVRALNLGALGLVHTCLEMDYGVHSENFGRTLFTEMGDRAGGGLRATAIASGFASLATLFVYLDVGACGGNNIGVRAPDSREVARNYGPNVCHKIECLKAFAKAYGDALESIGYGLFENSNTYISRAVAACGVGFHRPDGAFGWDDESEAWNWLREEAGVSEDSEVIDPQWDFRDFPSTPSHFSGRPR